MLTAARVALWIGAAVLLYLVGLGAQTAWWWLSCS